MKRKIILRLSFLIAFLTLLWSCRNEDFVQAEKNPQRNNRDFFKHSKKGGTFAKTSADYVDILEAYNREKNFLSAMPDQEGMPIWDKMRIVKTENSTSLVIPLSEDNATMSSVFFALIDNKENTVKAINNITNDELRRVVFDPTIDVQKRESLFYTFMATDNYTFGNEVFTNIPQDLFVDDKLGEQNNRIVFHAPRFGDALATEATAQNGRVQVVYEVICVVIRHCTHHGPGACDGCNICQTESCSHSTTLVFTYPDPETGVVIYGYPEGGGGGGTPLPIPDPDPCGLTKAFYRLAPNCNGSTPVNSPKNPCAKAQIPVGNINTLLHDSNISSEMNALKGYAATNHYEYGSAIINTGSSNIAQTPYTNNDPNNPGHVSITIPPVGNYLASAHTHPDHGAAPPSVRDLYSTLENARDYPSYQGSFVFSHNGSQYAFVVNDRAKAIAFLTAFPFASNTTNEGRIFNENSQVGRDFLEIYENYMKGRLPSYSGSSQNDGMESAYAQILEKYDTGISFAKADANGNLKPLKPVSFLYEIPASGGKKITGYKAQPCS